MKFYFAALLSRTLVCTAPLVWCPYCIYTVQTPFNDGATWKHFQAKEGTLKNVIVQFFPFMSFTSGSKHHSLISQNRPRFKKGISYLYYMQNCREFIVVIGIPTFKKSKDQQKRTLRDTEKICLSFLKPFEGRDQVRIG